VRGRALRFYATHFDYGSANQAVRAQSAQLILADAPVGVPTFVAGDLNAEPGESGPLELADALVDLWAAANPSQPGLTMPASGPTRRIDFVFASAPAAPPVLEPLGARLLDEAEDGVLLSDHLGVAAAVAW
jgi:endonuclease/exonuclease/phosphatase family metal-dependent hydrolase